MSANALSSSKPVAATDRDGMPTASPLASPVSATSATSPTSPTQEAGKRLSEPQQFSFTGTGGEYFRIWIVNLLLTIVTFGIYSAWAKVRRLQYFYRNTQVADAIFDYHGNPKAILKGRILALVLFGAYEISTKVSVIATLAVAAVLVVLTPWILARSFRFRLSNSSYRGVRFRFRGSSSEAYRRLMLFPILIGVTGVFIWSLVTSFANRPTIGLILITIILPIVVVSVAVPFAHQQLKRFQHENAYFGQTPFFFYARPATFFKIYAKAAGLLIIGSSLAILFKSFSRSFTTWLAGTMFGWLFMMLYGFLSVYIFYLCVRPYLESRLQNLIWNNTELGADRFISTASARTLLWLHASNLGLIAITLGLYKPFAAIRLARYQIACLTIVPTGEFEEFLADEAPDAIGAAGQEVGELFDFDISL